MNINHSDDTPKSVFASEISIKLKPLVYHVALTYAEKGIRINSISPGYIETPLLEQIPPETKKEMIAKHPIGRLGKPEEIANAFVFMASDKASFITGTVLHVDGGYTAI